jgi:hypothetical protein
MKVQSEELLQNQQQLAALKEHIRSSDQQGSSPSEGPSGGGNSGGGSSSSSNNNSNNSKATEKVVKELEAKLSETLALKDKAEVKAKLAVDKIKVRLLFGSRHFDFDAPTTELKRNTCLRVGCMFVFPFKRA